MYKDVIRAASRDLDEYNLNLIHFSLLRNITIERYHQFLIGTGIPITIEDLKQLDSSLRSWVKDWYEAGQMGEQYPSALSKHIQKAKDLTFAILGKEKGVRLWEWSHQCWSFGPSFPGDFIWNNLLYHLVHYTKTLAKLPPGLYRKRPLRVRIEKLYIAYEKEKDRFEKSLRRLTKSSGQVSAWEVFLAQEYELHEQITEAYEIKETHEHLLFCIFWKVLNESLNSSEHAVLNEWMSREAQNSYYDAQHLELMNCKCLALAHPDILQEKTSRFLKSSKA
jgi:hypothetical protein